MDRELLNSIEELQDKIEGLEQDYNSALKRKEGLDMLKGIRAQIRTLKNELQLLEASLLDGLPQRKRL